MTMLSRKPPPRRNRFVREEKKAMLRINPRWKEVVLHVLWIACGVALGVLAFPLLQQQMNPPVARVIVNGNFHQVDRHDILARVPVFQGDHLLDVNLGAIQEQLEGVPWVFSARVSRRWPDAISIDIVEQTPIALWNDGQVLNSYGQVFDRQNRTLEGLPQLSGPSGNEVGVIERFREFSQLLRPFGMKVARLQQDEELAWEVETDNGIRLRLGATQALDKMQRFVFLYAAQLQHETRAVATVDLRYNNGAAVAWKNPLPAAPGIPAANAQHRG